jgi:cation diffusion facilitator CzcD-associated flavoprotein CzcO
MATLRTPKHLTGPDLGVAPLGFRAWWEAQHGAAGWAALSRIGRADWMAYLAWYRRVLDLPLRNGWRLTSLAPAGPALFELDFATPGGPRRLLARTVVLATGPHGSGLPDIPAAIAAALPPDRYRHTDSPIDLAAWAGQRIAVLGAGASGFDAAIAALEAGAAGVELCCRRPALPRDNPRRWMETAGFLAHYTDLPDARRWSYAHRLDAIGQPPPAPTHDRAMAMPGFRLHLGMDGVAPVPAPGGGIALGEMVVDRLILATGSRIAPAARPELAALLPWVACWADRYAPPAAEASARLAACPYLDRWGAFTPRDPEGPGWVRRVFTIAGGAALSLGPIATSISGMKYAVPRLVEGVRRLLFLDQQAEDHAAFLAEDHRELR